MEGSGGRQHHWLTSSACVISRVWFPPQILSMITILLIASSASLAQQQGDDESPIGVTLCACQPAIYEFTLDFQLTCDDSNVAGPGINETACLTELRGPDGELFEAANETPAIITNIQIFELDQDLVVIDQTVKSGSFFSGSTFTYTSIVTAGVETLDPVRFPRGFQLVATGVNEFDESIIQTYAILYDNDCGIFPLLFEQQRIGWTIFTDLGPPPTTVCPLSTPPPTMSFAPSYSPLFSTTPTISSMPTTQAREPSMIPTPVQNTKSPTTKSPSSSPPRTSPPSCAQFFGKGKGKGKGQEEVYHNDDGEDGKGGMKKKKSSGKGGKGDKGDKGADHKKEHSNGKSAMGKKLKAGGKSERRQLYFDDVEGGYYDPTLYAPEEYNAKMGMGKGGKGGKGGYDEDYLPPSAAPSECLEVVIDDDDDEEDHYDSGNWTGKGEKGSVYDPIDGKGKGERQKKKKKIKKKREGKGDKIMKKREREYGKGMMGMHV